MLMVEPKNEAGVEKMKGRRNRIGKGNQKRKKLEQAGASDQVQGGGVWGGRKHEDAQAEQSTRWAERLGRR
jgi:hypothetical protein